MAHIGIYWQWGREHAIWSKIQSEGHQVTAFWWNPGMETDWIKCVLLPKDFGDLSKAIKERAITLLLVGPESPLCEWIVDELSKNGVVVLWPTKETSLLLEGDKDGAKRFMKENNIPTAPWKTITQLDDGTRLYLKTLSFPIVVKANGLAAGKWVKVCKTLQECIQHIEDCFAKKYDTGEKVVIESFIPWREISAFAFIDTGSDSIKIFTTATDHKAEFDGGKGDNTWGMGTFSPAISDSVLDEKIQMMFQNVLNWLKKKWLKYTWPLFAWLMVDASGNFNILEYNVRFGDPETQSMLARMESGLGELALKNAQWQLNQLRDLQFSTKKAVTLVLTDPWYPRGGTHKGKEITWLNQISTDVEVFHMGTKKGENGEILVNGGRVLSLTALWDTFAQAQEKVYTAAKKILFWWDTPKYRTDIADFAVEWEKIN